MPMGHYFNYSTALAEAGWDRHLFFHHWWQAASADRRWSPPLYRFLYRALVRRREPHLQRMAPLALALDAMLRPDSAESSVYPTPVGGSWNERLVAAGLALRDPRREDGAVYLALPVLANDEESLARLLDAVAQRSAARGPVIAPVGLVPWWGAGVLVSHFNLPPPLHTPYNPPFWPELFEGALEPLASSALHTFALAEAPPPAPLPRGVGVAPFDPMRLAGDLNPLAAAVLASASFLPTDALELDFLLRSWGAAPLTGLLATVEGAPAGFALLQPDHAPLLRRAAGGRRLWGRAWLALRRARPARAGRLLLGGVAPQFEGQGCGRALWDAALAHAARAGWAALHAGPVEQGSPAAEFLAHLGAPPAQQYVTFSTDAGASGVSAAPAAPDDDLWW